MSDLIMDSADNGQLDNTFHMQSAPRFTLDF